MPTAVGKKLKRYIAVIVVVIVMYALWTHISEPQGQQRVSFGPAKEECGSIGRLRYCAYRAAGGTNGDIVYHLHGRNLDERIWNDDTYWTAMVQSAWQRSGEVPPTVVTLSFGRQWLLSPKGRLPESGLLNELMRSLPKIEEKIGTPRRRILLGESMGGLNVLVAGFTHPDQFQKIAALCPGVYKLSPFSSFSQMTAGLRRTGADPKIAFGIWMMAKNYVANEAEWRRISPIDLMKRMKPPFPELYLSNGLYDKYGNFEGTQLLAQTATERGAVVHWHPTYGGHCASDVSSLAQFLVTP